MPDGEQSAGAVVLSADTVDLDRLVAQDPVDAPQRLAAYRAVVADCIRRHGGRFDPSGAAADSEAVAVFDDAGSAVACACEIQEDLASRNAVLHRERRLWWRIGVACDDARPASPATGLRAAAGPGEVCLSGAVRDAVAHLPHIRCAFDGERFLPGAPGPVRIYRMRPVPPAPPAPVPGSGPPRAARNADRAYRLLSASLLTAVAAVLAAILVAASAMPGGTGGVPADPDAFGWDLVPAVLGLVSTVAATASVVLAYAGRSATAAGGTWVDSHFRFLVRTFWIALGAQLVGILGAAVLIGIALLAVLPVWVVVRCRRGRALLRRGAPHPRPDTWGFG